MRHADGAGISSLVLGAVGPTAPRLILGCLLVIALGSGCESTSVEPTDAGGILRVVVLPDASDERLHRRYAGLVDYLEESTGYGIRLVIPDDYDRILEVFGQGQADLAWLGGLTFAKAHARFGAEALVTRDVDVSFTSSFIAPVGSEGAGEEGEPGFLADFEGRPFAFGPRLSTSGHLMARAFLESNGISAESYFSEVRHSEGHDETVEWVRAGRVALAAVNSTTLRTLREEDPELERRVRVVATTTPYQNYVWAIPSDLDREARVALREAFLDLDPARSRDRGILGTLGASGFLPLESSDYDRLANLASSLGLLAESR